MKRVLFIDRDGTLIAEPDDFQVDSFAKLRFLPGVLTALSQIARDADFELVMVTNQDGLGTDSFREDDFWPVQNFIVETLAGEGAAFSEILIDRSFPHEMSANRKPGLGMLTRYLGGDFDLANSFVIGDRETDVALARNLGAVPIFIANPRFDPPEGDDVMIAESWAAIPAMLKGPRRFAERCRSTNETDIRVAIDLDGSGRASVSTGIAFFDHMLEQIARHGSFDLSIEARGDLEVDEHHTIEDTAITLGEAFGAALGDKRGIGRYGFCLPMDDCLAQVAIDLGGRNWIVWDADFRREMIGKMPTEMFFHFFKSFSDKALCNLNIKAEGAIEHHKIEAIFKAFAKALKMAVRREAGSDAVPSTKGTI